MIAQCRKGTPALNSSQKRNLAAIVEQSILIGPPWCSGIYCEASQVPLNGSQSECRWISVVINCPHLLTPQHPQRWPVRNVNANSGATGALWSQIQHLPEGRPPMRPWAIIFITVCWRGKSQMGGGDLISPGLILWRLVWRYMLLTQFLVSGLHLSIIRPPLAVTQTKDRIQVFCSPNAFAD